MWDLTVVGLTCRRSAISRLVRPSAHLASAHLASIHTSFLSFLSAKDLIVLAVWGAGAAALAAWRFSWLPGAEQAIR